MLQNTQITPDLNINTFEFEFTRAERRVFKAKERMTVSEHADRFREVVRGPWKGPWRTENTEYTRFPMDLFAAPWIRRMYLCWAPQTGKTQVGHNCLNYIIDQDPDTAFYVMADEKSLKRIVRRQMIPMFRTHRRVAELLSDRYTDTSQLSVTFQNGMDLLFTWASSVAGLASESARYMFFDEVSKYHPRINLDLGDQRTNTYQHTKKLMYFTTPEDEHDPITVLIRNEADILYLLHAICPLCGRSQRMTFDRIRWPKDIRDPRKIEKHKLAKYVCEQCEMGWDDSMRDQAVRAGRWVAYHHDNIWPFGKIRAMNPEDVPDRPENVAFHLPSWCSPFVSLSSVAGAFLRGLGDPEKHRIFVTQHEAHPWKQIIISTTEERILKAKVPELDPQVVPENAIALTCYVDVQKRGFWFAVRAFARNYTSWNIHYGFLSSWGEVEDLIFNSEYPKADGSGAMRIWRAAIDSGGGKYKEEESSAEEVYFWIIKNRGRGVPVWPTKGSSTPLANKLSIGKTIERAPSGRAIPGGLQIIRLDTDKLKDLYHYRTDKAIEFLSDNSTGQEMASFLHNKTGRDYARQIMAEVKEAQKKGPATYVQRYKDNHLLDCEVGCHALADPEWPGGGVHMVPAPIKQEPEKQKRRDHDDDGGNWQTSGGYQRPDWLNR